VVRAACCIVCGGEIEQARRGRPRETCSAACRQAACRRRRVAWPPEFEDREAQVFDLVASRQVRPWLAIEQLVRQWQLVAA
jgi:hypothetical protein